MKKLHILRDGKRVESGVELKNGRCSMMWSQYEVFIDGEPVGWLESGTFFPKDEKRYSSEMEELPD